MENLIDLINSEFQNAQYAPIGDRIWKHSVHSDFWVIKEVIGDYDLEGLQEEVFACLAGMRKDYPESEKNTSLLILQKVETAEIKNPQQVIEDENDVYYFKKYVIQYTDAEWDTAKGVVLQEGVGLGQLLMNTGVFEAIKRDKNSANHLLYTVAHKLPFVMMQAERRPYDPNPRITVDAGLQGLFERIENFRNMEGRNATEEDLTAASAFIDQWINEDRDEQHQD